MATLDLDSLLFGFQLEESELMGVDCFKFDTELEISSTVPPSHERTPPSPRLDADLDDFLDVLMTETPSAEEDYFSFPESTEYELIRSKNTVPIRGDSFDSSSSEDSMDDLAFLFTNDGEAFNVGSPRHINRSFSDASSDESDNERPVKRKKTHTGTVAPVRLKPSKDKNTTPVKRKPAKASAATSMTPRQAAPLDEGEDDFSCIIGCLLDDFESVSQDYHSPSGAPLSTRVSQSPAKPEVPLLKRAFKPDSKSRRRRNFPASVEGSKEYAIALLRDRSKPPSALDNCACAIEFLKGLVESAVQPPDIVSKKRKSVTRSVAGLTDEVRAALARLAGCVMTAEIAPLASSGAVFFGRFTIKGTKDDNQTSVQISGLTRCSIENGFVTKAVVTLDAHIKN